MNYLDKIKQIFFTDSDLQGSTEHRLRSTYDTIIRRGAQSRLLMTNPVFQEAVGELYLNLEAQLDMVEDTDPDAHDRIQWLRVQRRGLRQVCAVLDNAIAAQEQLENSLKEQEDESKSYGNA